MGLWGCIAYLQHILWKGGRKESDNGGSAALMKRLTGVLWILVESTTCDGECSRLSHLCTQVNQKILLLSCQSVPEMDPAATMPKSQSQPRTSAGTYPSSSPASYSTLQAPALSVTGPITANSEQVFVCFQDINKPAPALLYLSWYRSLPEFPATVLGIGTERWRPSPWSRQIGDHCKNHAVLLR